nr:TetR/AcrR family transcriptional regulator [Mycolicibacterium komanii]
MKSRKYDMSTREAAKLGTRDAIIDACVQACMAQRSFGVTLATVAERAGVTVKTVLRHFGSRDDLLDAAFQRAYDEAIAERTSPPGDIESALDALIAHYERLGDVVLAMLAQDDSDARAQRMNATGRLTHRAWVEEVFDEHLPSGHDTRSRVVDALVVATDVYCWKILRRDRKLSVPEVRDRILLLTEAVLAHEASLRHR